MIKNYISITNKNPKGVARALFSRYEIFCFLYSNFSKTRKTRLVMRIRRKQILKTNKINSLFSTFYI